MRRNDTLRFDVRDTGYGGTDLEERAISAGARGFLHKPYNLQEISKKLRGILDVP